LGETVGLTADLSYGGGKWLFTTGNAYTMPPAATSLTFKGGIAGFQTWKHVRASTTGKTVHYHQTSDNLLILAENNYSTVTTGVGNVPIAGGGPFMRDEIAIDPTGMYLMSRRSDTGTQVKSSDGGYTWVNNGVVHLPPLAFVKYRYVSGVGAGSCWVAAEFHQWYSNDFGTNWIDKTGDLHNLSAFIGAAHVRVIGF
jgi:hypothetical protein